MRLIDNENLHGRRDATRLRGMVIALGMSAMLWAGMFGMVRTIIG